MHDYGCGAIPNKCIIMVINHPKHTIAIVAVVDLDNPSSKKGKISVNHHWATLNYNND